MQLTKPLDLLHRKVVAREVQERVAIIAERGGFVFNTVDNIQSNVPTANLLARVWALQDLRGLGNR